MKLGHVIIIVTIFLTATIAISIPSYNPNSKLLLPTPETTTNDTVVAQAVAAAATASRTHGGMTCPTSDGSDTFNRTSALSDGIKGYILARLITKPTGPMIAIPVNGTIKVQVELWFVSYDWMNATETNVTISSKVAGTPMSGIASTRTVSQTAT